MKIALVKWKFTGDERKFNMFLENVVNDYLDVDPIDKKENALEKDDEQCA